VRTRIGPFQIEDSVTPEQLTRETFDEFLLSPTLALGEMRTYSASADDLTNLRAGRAFGDTDETDGETIAVLGPDQSLVCLAKVDGPQHRLFPRRVFLD
jgi:hypothetical protein